MPEPHPPTPALVDEALRLARLDQPAIGEHLGVTPGMLAHWRKGRNTPRPDSLYRLGELLARHAERLLQAGVGLMERAARGLPKDDPRRRVPRAPRSIFGDAPAAPAATDGGPADAEPSPADHPQPPIAAAVAPSLVFAGVGERNEIGAPS